MQKIKKNGKVYTVGEDIFKIKNKWIPIELTSIDTYTNERFLTEDLNSYIDLHGNLKYTSYLVNLSTNNGIVISICKSIIDQNPSMYISFTTYKGLEFYYLLGAKSNANLNNIERYSPSTKIYSVEEVSKPVITYTSKENLLSLLKNYTYGFELETTASAITENESYNKGFYSLYDGSITGPEYASGIMKYDNFHYLETFLLQLSTNTNYDNSCSFHFHIGNIPYNESNLEAIYSLFQRLQEDLNLLIAPYKKDYTFLYNKQKDHCKNLPLIDDIDSNKIFRLLKLPLTSDREELLQYLKAYKKWNISGRYYTVNFINYICKENNNTIELRSLQMSSNYEYILTWVIINTAIIDYAINNVNKVLAKKEKIQVDDCLRWFIKDEQILNNVLFNYDVIKHIIYNEKYLNENVFLSPKNLDDKFSNKLKIIDRSIDIQKINKLIKDYDRINTRVVQLGRFVNGASQAIQLNSLYINLKVIPQFIDSYNNLDEESLKELIKSILRSLYKYDLKDITSILLTDNNLLYSSGYKIFDSNKITFSIIISSNGLDGVIYIKNSWEYYIKLKDVSDLYKSTLEKELSVYVPNITNLKIKRINNKNFGYNKVKQSKKSIVTTEEFSFEDSLDPPWMSSPVSQPVSRSMITDNEVQEMIEGFLNKARLSYTETFRSNNTQNNEEE